MAYKDKSARAAAARRRYAVNPEKYQARRRLYYERHREEVLRRLKEARAANPEPFREARARSLEKHRQKYYAQHREYARNAKLMVLLHYSDGELRCACCGESILEFLQLDHINNDGNLDRRARGLAKGTNFYLRLIGEGFPGGFQVLCANCNIGKHLCGGVCPHRRAANDSAACL